MIRLNEVLTAGGTATLKFELYDLDGNRATGVPSGATRVSIRKRSTARQDHELPLLNASLDASAGTVTLDLSTRDTETIGPAESGAYPAAITCVADVRIISPDATTYYGPYEFDVRLAETYTPPGLGPYVSRIDIDSITETAAIATLRIENHDGSLVYLRWRDSTAIPWQPALSATANSAQVVFAITGLMEGVTYQVRASFDAAFAVGVEAARFDTPGGIVTMTRYTYWAQPYTVRNPMPVPVPTVSEVLAGGGQTDLPDPAPLVYAAGLVGSGYAWYIMPAPITHYSLQAPNAFNQIGALILYQQVQINGADYWWYWNPNGSGIIITTIGTYTH